LSSEDSDRWIKVKQYHDKVIYALWSLVKIVNATSNSSIPVTLFVKGTIICGDVMSLKQFHEDFGITIPDGLDDSNKEVRDAMKSIIDGIISLPAIDENNELNFDYVCLRNATFWLPGQSESIAISIPAWIGKLDSVDGFFLGQIPNRMNKG
jgi:hypothetical protein